jgi:restriction system protein
VPGPTPEEAIAQVQASLSALLTSELLGKVRSLSPSAFETLVIELLLAMGYGGSRREAARALGRSGDDGVDGVIDEDALGLDRVFVQAKRYAAGNDVSPAAIREFSGSLDLKKASKGLFVTTSAFSKAARETAEQLRSRIVLIDGEQLAALMIRFGIGCRVVERIDIKRLDEDFFEDLDT